MKIMILIMLGMTILLIVQARRYRSSAYRMKVFCFKMAKNAAFRELYGKKLLIFLLLFHFIYQTIYSFQTGILFSMILTCCLFHKTVETRMLRRINEDRRTFTLLFIITMVTMFIPSLYSLSFTLGTLLMASFFYPPKRITHNTITGNISDDMGYISENYFDG